MNNNFLGFFWCRWALVFFLAIQPVAGLAFDAQVVLTSKDKKLQTRLSQRSLVVTAQTEGVTAAQDILAAAQSDYGNLLGVLYDNGYFGPVIQIKLDGREAASIPPLENLKSIRQVVIAIDTGPSFKLGQARINPISPDTKLPEAFATGAPARTDIISDAAAIGIDGWRDLSYAKARIASQSIIADHKNAQLNVDVELDPGPAVKFGRITAPSPSKVRKDRILEIAGIPSGQSFDPAELERGVTRLRRSGAFSSVTADEAETLGSDNTMDIGLEVVDAKPRRFGFGAEIESTEGITLSGFWLHRNLFGGAERLRISLESGGVAGDTDGPDTSLDIDFIRPSTFTSDTDLYGLVKLEHLDEDLYNSDQITLGAGVNHYFSEKLEGSIGFAIRHSDVDDDLGSRTFTHLTFPMSLTLDKRDDKLDATKGFYISADLLPYIGLNGDESGARSLLDGRYYKALGGSDVVLAGRLQLGSISGSSLTQTPPDLLFLSGGSGTVRGQSYQSLFVRTGLARTGGRSFFGASGEARFPIKGKFGAVAFYDLGYIGRKSLPDGSGDWHAGAGLGARYKTGFGPVRVDMAVPVSGPDTSGFEFYIGIGQAF